MRVLFINTVYGRGSTGRIVADLGKMLEENGHEFKVAYGRGDNSADPHCYRIGNNLDMCIHAGLSRITDRAGFYSKNATKKLVSFIKDYNPDIIHLHNLHGYYLSIEILFKYLAEEFRGRVIWTLHDCWAFTGHCVHYSFAKCEKWKENGCGYCPEKKRYPASMILDNSTSNYEKKRQLFTALKDLQIVAPSEWLKTQVEESFLGSYPSNVINNGIDLNVFKPKNYKPHNKKILLNVIDGEDERKGFNDLLRLSQMVPEEYVIIIVGCKENRTVNEKCKIIKKTATVEELIMYYSNAFCFLNTTYEDTFPTVNLEALACGLPVITYNSGGSPEVLNNKCGKVIEKGDLKALLQAIQDSQFDKSECIEQARKYNKETKYKEYLCLYDRSMEK